MPIRSAIPGRYHTGSMAALNVLISTPRSTPGNAASSEDLMTMSPSMGKSPLRARSSSSSILI